MSAGAAPNKDRAAKQPLPFLFEWAQDRALIVALLGGPGTGKSVLLSSVIGEAQRRRWHTVLIDLRAARELWEQDDFYNWLVQALKQEGLGTWKTRNARLDFNRLLEAALARSKKPVLLALDHAEQLSDTCARSLIATLREIQDSGSSKPGWAKLRCVLSGCVSVFDLRRRYGSPNLQFKIQLLPDYTTTPLESTREFLSKRGQVADDQTVYTLAELAAGEHFFLDLLTRELPASISEESMENAVQTLLKGAGRIRHLSLPAALYLLDEDFRSVADGLLDNRWVRVSDSEEDISRYQLIGATRVDPARPDQVEFRNGLIRRLLSHVGRSDAVSPELSLLARVREAILSMNSTENVIAALRRAWQHLAYADCTLRLSARGIISTHSFEITSNGIQLGTSRSNAGIQCAAPFNLAGIETTISRMDSSCVVVSSWASAGVLTSLSVEPAAPFLPNISSRILIELWTRFLNPLREKLLEAGLQSVGTYALNSGLTPPKKVFVSSTFLDLAEHRAHIMEQIQRRDLFFRGMEFFGAASKSSAQFILEQVRRADVYLGIYGRRYGSLDAKSGLSMTELEYDEAVRSNKPRLCYVTHHDAPVRSGDFESDPDKLAKLNNFLQKVKRDVVYEFKDIGDLAHQVYIDLGDSEKLNS